MQMKCLKRSAIWNTLIDMPKARVLQLVTSFLRFKGDDSFNHLFMKRLVDRGVEIDVIVPHDRENSLGFEVIDGIRIHRFQYFFPKRFQRIAYHGGVAFNLANSWIAKAQFPFFMLSFFLKTAKHLRNHNIIHAQWVPSGLIAVFFKLLTGKPVVLWIHRMVYRNPITKALTSFVLNNADYVMFNASYTTKKAQAISNMRDFGIVSPSVDETLFRPMPKPGLRKKLGLSPSQKIIFSAGRFVEKKGFPYLVEAMKHVKAKDIVCVIAGYGPKERELKQLVKERGLEKKVLFVGRIPNAEIPLWMNEADLIVVPSIIDSTGETETLGIVAIEAIACAKPVIVSKVGGLVDVVKDGYNGFLVRQKQPLELAEKIDQAFKNPAKLKQLGKNARAHCEQNFSWDSAVEKTIKIYEKALRGI